MVSKKEFLRAISDKTGYTQKDISAVLDGIRAVTVDVAKAEDSVRLFDGLVIKGQNVPAHEARNPQTGETIDVPEKTKMVCKVGASIKRDLQ